MSRWFRAYDDALDDPKVQRLSDAMFRAWFNLMCVTSKNGGKPFPLDEIAFRLRVTPARAAATAKALIAAGLLDEVEEKFVSHNWDKRQFKSDTSNDRVKRHRQRSCNVTGTVTETPPEQNRSEQNTARAQGVELRIAVVKAFENANSPNIPDTSRVDLWLSQGYESEIILATISTILARNPSISSLNYFDGAIKTAHENRAPSPKKPAQIDWEKWVDGYRRKGVWNNPLGPEPGYDGCRAPREILQKHGYLEGAA